MLGIKKVFITESKQEYEVTAIKHHILDDDNRYSIDIFTDSIDGNDYYITDIPLHVTHDGSLLIGDIGQLEATDLYEQNGTEFILNAYKAMPIIKNSTGDGLTLKTASLVNDVAIA